MAHVIPNVHHEHWASSLTPCGRVRSTHPRLDPSSSLVFPVRFVVAQSPALKSKNVMMQTSVATREGILPSVFFCLLLVTGTHVRSSIKRFASANQRILRRDNAVAAQLFVASTNSRKFWAFSLHQRLRCDLRGDPETTPRM